VFRIEFDDETLRRAINGAAKSEKWLNPKPLSTRNQPMLRIPQS